jgi:hypothetical protein
LRGGEEKGVKSEERELKGRKRREGKRGKKRR